MQILLISAVFKRISCLYMYSTFHNSMEQILLTKAVLLNLVKKFLARYGNRIVMTMLRNLALVPYSKPAELNQHPHILFL
jgi:hypothetical protein